MMYRVIVIVGGALALAACSSSSTPDWMKPPDWAKPNWNLDAFKPAPILDTVRFESEPPGAEAKTSNGQSCRTPCALALPLNAPLTVTFTLNGYQPETENIKPSMSTTALDDAPSTLHLWPNPVVVELTPAPPAKPAAKKPPARKTSATKPAAKPAARANPAAATASTPPPMSASPAPQQAPAPWPSTPPPQR